MRLRPLGDQALIRRLVICAAVASGPAAFVACGGGSNEPEEKPIPTVLTPELLASTWAVRMVDAATRAPFEANPGWAELVIRRDYPAALSAFSSGNVEKGLGRVHMELAAAYRQATLINAAATENVFGRDRRDEDPAFTHCLRAVAEAITAKPDVSQASYEACKGEGFRAVEDGDLAAEAKAWAWSEATGEDLSGINGHLAALKASSGTAAFFGDSTDTPWNEIVGTMPGFDVLPHFSGPDRLNEGTVEGVHAGSLAALAEAHRQAALSAWPDGAAQISAALEIWRLPLEDSTFSIPDVWDDALVFGSSVLAGPDYAYLAELSRTDDAKLTTENARTNSPLAAALAPCLKSEAESSPTVDVECVVDAAAGVHAQVRAEMVARAGEPEDYHRAFYDLARVSVLRAAADLAAANGEELTMGRLRILALERSTGPAADPVPLLQLAAWDAGNRNVVRAQEPLHGQVGHLPGVEAARYPLDSLHVRLSRESGPAVPVH